ncbi:MAG: S1C family serine protease [Candidatus Promineifilaceae bacterium]|jgi:serine protease Do
MYRQPIKWISFFFGILLLAALACGPGGDEEPTPTAVVEDVQPTQAAATPVPTDLPTDTPVPMEEPTSMAVSSLDDLESAVVQIVAEGSFVDPQEGLLLNQAGSGSGFIIDESGLAVTNNHVVTGAALLRVYVGGDSEAKNARVLAVSECSDLAVIDIEGEGYPYLEWYQGPINTGLQVYAAGFPLGDPEFTLTQGIVAKDEASGISYSSSADSVLQHDATINPGNSGGPLVSADGKVVGINYQGNKSTDSYYAIGRDEALKILDDLIAGNDVTSIGINGFAISDDAGTSGIWVSSVESGSPAERAGVTGGDIITSIEGLVLATDGSMEDYCAILRSHAPEDTYALEVLRYSTGEVLSGQLNGDPLTVDFSFADEIEGQVGDDFGDPTAGLYNEYVQVVDDTGYLTMDVPVEWSDVDGRYLVDDNDDYLASAIEASSNLDDFWGTYSTPGVAFYASDVLAQDYDVAGLLDYLAEDYDCDYDGRYEYDDGVYSGLYDLYVNCGNSGSVIIELSAEPAHQGYLVYLVIQAISDADIEAMQRVLDTFFVAEE